MIGKNGPSGTYAYAKDRRNLTQRFNANVYAGKVHGTYTAPGSSNITEWRYFVTAAEARKWVESKIIG